MSLFSNIFGVSESAKKESNEHFRRGYAAGSYGNLEGAIGELKIALNKNPDNVEARTFYAISLEKKGLYDDAIKEYQKAIKTDPGNFEAHANYGKLLKNQGRLDDAIVELKEAVRIQPNNMQGRFHLGVV